MNMICQSKIFLCFLTLGIIFPLLGQSGSDAAVSDRIELDRLRIWLDRTAGMVKVLPDVPNTDFRQSFEQLLANAEEKYDEAAAALERGEYQLATTSIRAAFAILSTIENAVTTHPVIKVKFKQELNRKIQRAQAVVRRTGNADAIKLLDRALRLREQAALKLEQGKTIAAIDYYWLAMNTAELVVRLYGQQDADKQAGNWRDIYNDTHTLLEKVRSRSTGGNSNPSIENQVNMAETELSEVKRLYEDGEFTTAKRKLTGVNRLLYRLMETVEKDTPLQDTRLRSDAEMLRSSLARLEARSENEKSPVIRRLLDRAQSLNKEIDQHIEKDQRNQARKKLKSATIIINQADQLSSKSRMSNREMLDQGITNARKSLTRIQQKDKSWPAAERLVGMIEMNLANAEMARADKRPMQAARFLEVTNVLILQFNMISVDRIKKEVRAERAKYELDQLGARLEQLGQSQSVPADQKIKIDSAASLYELALEAYEKQNWKICNALTKSAIDLLAQ